MAKNLLFDCSYSEVWVHPKNYKTLTSKKSLDLDWYVECKFYDPLFKEKYPKGFPFRKKLNRFKTLDERKAAIQLLLKEIPKLFEDKGYNPITKKFMIAEEKPASGVLHPKLNFIEALEITYPKLSVSEGVKKEFRRIVAKTKKSAAEQRIEFPICEIHSGHIRDLLDYLNLTPNEYNKYLTHLSMILSDLVEKRMVFHNPIRDIKKKKTIKKLRETLEVSELVEIFKVLKIEHPTFYRYGMIFFHSGARSAELFRVQKKDVNIEKQEYKVTIRKGNSYREVKKVILKTALPFWKEIIDECTSENDYLFTRGLKPSEVPTQPYQITKRWKRLVKDKYNITADFYALKHLFLDELDKSTTLSISKNMANHTTDITEKVYLVGRESRKNEVLKNINIDIFAS
jgi:integrase